jgi:hypothetical protein
MRHTYATLSRAPAASVCEVCSGQHSLTRQDGHGYMLVIGSNCAPARLGMHSQPLVQSASHAGCELSGLRACTASDLAADPGLRGKHTCRLMHARWTPEGFMPRRPRTACLCGCVNLFTSSLVLCLLTTVYESVVTSWRCTPDKRMQECSEGLSGPPEWAGVHPIRMGAGVCVPHLLGSCWCCAHCVLRYPPHARPHRSQTTHQ